MSSTWFKGPARRRTVKMQDGNTALVQFSTPHRPPGSDIDLPPGKASIVVDHNDQPIGVKVFAWSRDNDGKGVPFDDVDRAVAGEQVNGARCIGDAQIVAEGAVRKKTDSEGSEVEEHRFTLRVAFDDKVPFNTTPLGQILREKRTVLSLTEGQVMLPEMPPKRRPGRPPKKDVAQLRLGEKPDDEEGDPHPAELVDSQQQTTPPAAEEASASEQAAPDFTAVTTKELLRRLEHGEGTEASLKAVQEELNRREPMQAQDDATTGETMLDKANKARRRGRVVAEA